MKKGIAVSQIVLLVLGILVLAVVAYLLYTNFLTSSGSFDAEKCRAEQIRSCTAAKIIPRGIDASGTTTREYDTPSCQQQKGTIDCNAVGISGGSTTGEGQKQVIPPPKAAGGI